MSLDGTPRDPYKKYSRAVFGESWSRRFVFSPRERLGLTDRCSSWHSSAGACQMPAPWSTSLLTGQRSSSVCHAHANCETGVFRSHPLGRAWSLRILGLRTRPREKNTVQVDNVSRGFTDFISRPTLRQLQAENSMVRLRNISCWAVPRGTA